VNAQERKKIILEKLNEEGIVRIAHLSKLLKTSRETVRKDLYELEKENLIKKVHGGAVRDISNQETAYEKRISDHEEGKKLISQQAVSYIENGDTIYLDYGTTTYQLAKLLHKFTNITVITNSIPIVNVLMRYEGIQIVIPGGILRKNEGALVGAFANDNINKIFADIGFFGCAGIEAKNGLTNFHMDESEVSKKMMKQSQTTIVLAHSSKIGITALNHVANLNTIDIIITDEKLADQEQLDAIGKQVALKIANDAE